MASNLHSSVILISLVFFFFFFFFFFHLSSARFYSNENTDLIKTVCKDSTDNQFCIQTFGNDPRTSAYDSYGLCLTSISLIIEHATETSLKLLRLQNKVNDHMTHTYLLECEYYYEDGLREFHEAYKSALAMSYKDVLVKIDQGLKNGIKCNVIFESNDLVSPFASETEKLQKLGEVPSLVIKHV